MTANVLNVCSYRSDDLLGECEALAGYVRLVKLVRANRSRGLPFDEAVNSAIQQCIDEGVLTGYLTQRRSTVIDMFMDEYDEEKIGALFREDGRREGLVEGLVEGLAEGLAEGLEKGRQETLVELVRDGVLSVQDAASRAGVSEDEIRQMAFDAPVLKSRSA